MRAPDSARAMPPGGTSGASAATGRRAAACRQRPRSSRRSVHRLVHQSAVVHPPRVPRHGDPRGRSAWSSSPAWVNFALLIRGFGVRVPGGAPRIPCLTWPFASAKIHAESIVDRCVLRVCSAVGDLSGLSPLVGLAGGSCEWAWATMCSGCARTPSARAISGFRVVTTSGSCSGPDGSVPTWRALGEGAAGGRARRRGSPRGQRRPALGLDAGGGPGGRCARAAPACVPPPAGSGCRMPLSLRCRPSTGG
jgi:hypothetical protein